MINLISRLTNQQLGHLTEARYRGWISAYWEDVCYTFKTSSFEDKKEAFFDLLGRMLRERKARFIAPGADCYISFSNPHPKYTIDDEAALWHAPVDEIIAELRSKWPKHVTDPGDVELTYYFYEIPGIIWLGEDGKWHGS